MKFFAVKTLSGHIKPAYDSDHEALKKIKANEVYQVEIIQPRNIKFHRKFFVLINLVFDNQNENQKQYTNIEHLRRDLIIEAGFYDVRYNIQGVQIYEPKSISFAKMKQDEFDKLYNAVVDVIVKYFHFNKEELINEVLQNF